MILHKQNKVNWLLGAALSLLSLSNCVTAKTSSGEFHLSAHKTDHVLSAYSIAAGASGLITAVLISDEQYKDTDENLKMHFYLDDDWPKVKKAKTCEEKTRLARQTESVKFEREDFEQKKKWGPKKPRWRSETHVKIDPLEDENDYAPRHHYWYIVVDDCSLEGASRSAVPNVNYYVQIYNMMSENSLTHLSTDEFALSRIHMATMFLGGLICVFLFGKISYSLATARIVHIATIIVLGAACFDTASSAFELLHLMFYRFDGIGIYFLDAASAYNEAICDAVVSFLILSIAAGWTLPSDVISVRQGQDATTFLHTILAGLSNPTARKGWMNPFTGTLLGLTATHLMLAHLGLSYNDEYDSYHNLEHFPGKLLMGMRSTLGLLMLAAIAQTRMKCSASLHPFYAKFAVVGTMWFQGLPIITWSCNTFVAFHRRHPTVIIAAAVLQSASLCLLSWIVAMGGPSTYHKVSHITQCADNNLTEKMTSLEGSSTSFWKVFGGRAKVRLD